MKLVNLPPGLSPTLQLYARNSDNTVGSAVGTSINGTAGAVSTEYNFELSSRGSGDWYAVLSGVSNPDGGAFPVRDDVAYFIPWAVIDATIRSNPPTPDPISGMCNLLISTTQSGCRVWAKLADDNNTADQVLVSQQVVEDTTDQDGNATLVLIQYGQFTAGGNYRIRVADSSRFITNNVLVRMPDTSSANLEDLTPL